MRRYRRFERPFRPPARWAATRHATEQYRASARLAMKRSPQWAQATRRMGCPQVGHFSGGFLAGMQGTVTEKTLQASVRARNISTVAGTFGSVR